MAAQTFGELVNSVALHAPSVPFSLIQQWVQTAYDELCGKRHWAFLRKEYILSTLASRSISVTYSLASTTITSAALFVSTDAGRQIRIGNGVIYTIDTVTNASTAILTALYREADYVGAQTATISDIYLVMPADFRSFHSCTDLIWQRPIAWWIARDRLDLYDPARIMSQSRFRTLCAYQLSEATATAGQLLYEAWPHPTSAGTYMIEYFQRSDALGDDTAFKGVLATKTQAIQQAALASCARWPGTPAQKNPYFNLALAAKLDQEANEALNDVDIMDDDQYLMDLQQVNLARYGLGALAADTTLLRASDATVADYL